MGLLEVLATASDLGRVDAGQAIDRLRRTNFRVSPELLKALLERAIRLRFEELVRKVPDVEPDDRVRLD